MSLHINGKVKVLFSSFYTYHMNVYVFSKMSQTGNNDARATGNIKTSRMGKNCNQELRRDLHSHNLALQ